MSKQFLVDGAIYTEAQMLDANQDDDELRAWIERAEVGDAFPAIVSCERVQ